MIERVVGEACKAWLGINSICEFGRNGPEATEVHAAAARTLNGAIARRVREAQADGEVPPDLNAATAAGFIAARFASIRLAARAGASAKELADPGQMTMRALQ